MSKIKRLSEAAQRIAHANPEWEHKYPSLRHTTTGDMVIPRGARSWGAYRDGWKRIRGENGRAKSFGSAEAAIRALGYAITEEPA